jgi:hypothetical protein
MNQTKSELSRTIETKDNLINFRRNVDLKQNYADLSAADEDIFAILDTKAPTWNSEIVDMRNIGKMVLITASVSIDGVTRHGIGTASNCIESEILSAERNALICAAKKFGFVREALFTDSFRKENVNSPARFPENPMAQSLFDLITSKQISLIKSVSEFVGLNAEKECHSVMQCGVGELSRKAAASFIAHLEAISGIQPIEVEPSFMQRAG